MTTPTPQHPEHLAGAGTLASELIASVVNVALTEDLGGNPGRDVTTFATIPSTQERTINVVARQDGVVAGLAVVQVAMSEVARRLNLPEPAVEVRVSDGQKVAKGDVLAQICGRTHVLLVAERTALNLLCRMSGVATHTREWSTQLQGTGAKVLDTRKTTPGLRAFEKYAVRCGGGTNKRMGLYDVAMIKDNHKLAAGSITAAFENVRAMYPDVPVQVEVTTPDEATEAVRAGARFLLCDNMSPEVLREAVRAARAVTPERVELEATGGLTVERAAEYGTTGVDYMSVGGLTHSSPIMDIAMDLVEIDSTDQPTVSETQEPSEVDSVPGLADDVAQDSLTQDGGGHEKAAATPVAATDAESDSPTDTREADGGTNESLDEGTAEQEPASGSREESASDSGDAVVSESEQASSDAPKSSARAALHGSETSEAERPGDQTAVGSEDPAKGAATEVNVDSDDSSNETVAAGSTENVHDDTPTRVLTLPKEMTLRPAVPVAVTSAVPGSSLKRWSGMPVTTPHPLDDLPVVTSAGYDDEPSTEEIEQVDPPKSNNDA